MARSLEQTTAAALGTLHFQLLSLQAQCEKQQDEIAELKKQLDVKPAESKARTLKSVPDQAAAG